jgi:hypothetical protein
MAPSWRLRLVLLLVAGAAAAAALATATTNASPSASCATGQWPAGTHFTSVPPPASARVSFASGRWRLWLRPAARWALTGRMTADAGLGSIRATAPLASRLHRGPRALWFALPGGSGPARLSFTSRCAHRMAFDFAGARVLIGRKQAPASRFQIQRPPTTSVTGQLIAGPTCPVERPGENCPPPRKVQGKVEIDTAPTSRSSPNGTPVETVSSDSSGHFSAELPPGDYTLTALASGPAPPAGRMSRSESVRVESGVVSEVTLVFDTGIR